MPELAPWNQLFHFIKHMACKNSICLLMKRLLVVALPGEHPSGIKTKSSKSMILHPLLSCISLGALKREMKSLRPPIPSTFLLLALNTCLVRQLLPHLPQVFTALLVESDATHSRHLTHHHCPSWCSSLKFKTLSWFKLFLLPFLYVEGTGNECSNLNSTRCESQKNFQQKVFDIATHFPIFRHKEWFLKSIKKTHESLKMKPLGWFLKFCLTYLRKAMSSPLPRRSAISKCWA